MGEMNFLYISRSGSGCPCPTVGHQDQCIRRATVTDHMVSTMQFRTSIALGVSTQAIGNPLLAGG